jgi:hypothetical protein
MERRINRRLILPFGSGSWKVYGPAAGGAVLESMSTVIHEAIPSFELVSLRTFRVGLNDVGHHDESVVARCSKVLQVLDHHRQVRHTLKPLE